MFLSVNYISQNQSLDEWMREPTAENASRAEMDTGKSLGCAREKPVPTGLKKAATFIKDGYLKNIESYVQ